MSIDDFNIESDWKGLQEANVSLIVLDRNDLIVSCNNRARNTLLESSADILVLSSFFWLEAEQRTFHLHEFKKLIGKSIRLLLTPSHGSAYQVKVSVEELGFSRKLYCGLVINSLYTELVNEELSQRSKIATALHQDLVHNALELAYQPQVNIVDNSLHGVEVLARWDNRYFGTMSPGYFVPIAEEFGIIAELDLWVLHCACQQLAAWRKQGVDVPSISVNFSPCSFDTTNIQGLIESVLKLNDIPASDLVLEITESKTLNMSGSAIDSILDLQSIGVKISLDDFGTGYSNFKRLLKFPVTQLKLDRAFVSELPTFMAKELSQTIFNISENIGATSIAEGIETEQTFEIVKDIGYKIIQGYFFSPPLPKVEFESWLFKFRQ